MPWLPVGTGSPVAELDGSPVQPDQVAQVAAGLAFGHFTAMSVREGRVRGLQLHLDRLARDCSRLFGAELDVDRVRTLLRQVADRRPGAPMLRASVFRLDLDLAHPAAGVDEPNVLVTTRASTSPSPRSGGLRVRTVRYVRDLPEVKHLGTFGAVQQRRQAQAAGVDDALFVAGDPADPLVCEGPTWNVAALVDGTLVWPDADCLPGITQALVERTAPIPCVRRALPLQELLAADAAVATSAGIGVRPLTSVDGTSLTASPDLLTSLQAAYAALPADAL